MIRSTSRLAVGVLGVLGVLAAAGVAAAEPKLAVSPAAVHPGDAVVVSVLGATTPPEGKAGGQPLRFFPAKAGYQAVFAAALDINEDHVLVEVTGGPKPVSVAITPVTFPETKLVVEDEMANPPKADRERIDADNRAIEQSYAKAAGAPLFTRGFRRPAGATTSTFGEWRTFNDGHRAQHLGLDLGERENTKVAAINAGTVVLVRDTFLAGNIVVVAHGAGISSLYFHLAKTTVAEGDAVVQGAELGRVGHTGRTTGPHLHLSIHVAGGLVDPTSFFALPLAPAATAPAGT